MATAHLDDASSAFFELLASPVEGQPRLQQKDKRRREAEKKTEEKMKTLVRT